MSTPTQPSDNVKQSLPENQLIHQPFSNGQRMTHRRKRKVELPECAEDVLTNLHRYPLLVWHDPTSSKDSEDSLLEREDTITLLSFVTSKCEAEKVIEWKDLMEWFVCSVIGLDSKVSWLADSFSFGWGDVILDGSGTARINLFPSPSDSSPPHSTQSFSAAISNLSHLFLVLIGQCSMSNCLPERINPHFRDKLVPTVFLRLINHLIDTDRIVPIFEPSDLDEVIGETINNCNKELDNGLGLHDALLWIVAMVYVLVNIIENAGLVSHTVRLTDPEFDYHSPLFTGKADHVVEELLKKIADGEEVENDKSFLKLPFFRPTLLSLQAKFQHLASFSDHSEDSSMSSLHSSHFSPHTSLEAHIGSSLRTRSSGTLFKQESLQLLTLFHSLVTSPLPPSLPKQSPDDSFQAILAFYPLNDLDPTERFDSSLFDEEDDEILTKSLIRCFFVCELVGAEHSPTIKSALSRPQSTTVSSNAEGLLPIASRVESTPLCIPRWMAEEQYALIQISAIWIDVISDGEALPPFPFSEFDWDGLFTTDLSDRNTFFASIRLIMAIRSCSIENKIEQTQSNHIILSFERRHLASSRLNLEFEDYIQANLDVNFVGILLSYSLMMALLIQSGFPSCETIYIETHPEMDICKVLPIQHNFVLLCHTSLNQHKPHQPPLDLLFERTLRTDPLAFFLPFVDPQIDIALSPQHVVVWLSCTLSTRSASRSDGHRICPDWQTCDQLILAVHISFHFGHIPSLSPFPSPLIVRFFLPFLWLDRSHDVLVDPLRLIIPALLLFTAPFGDCRSLKELFRSVRHGNNVDHDNSTELRVTTRCQNLEWLNIPTGFGSALVHSITRERFGHFEHQIRPRRYLGASFFFLHVPLHPRSLSDTSRLVSYDISFVGNAIFNKFGDELNPFVTERCSQQFLQKCLSFWSL
ncbi:hypothetical protein BLNAU_25232 [Blattamonas nauphoetae]|uniref:SEC7 domain-containing protein n=1 Tax=Blattamonas nauphoetae TaxID=2049346 RepID=A0ABQ9WKJ8_9EUKA|nr:hypothetical protein BLNAU_25232 [Blattamonas nauphoetae]